MSKQGSSRKSLIIGIIAAVVVLGALLAVLLTQCTGNQNATESTPAQTTEEAVPTYELYWNLDRAEYDGKSEAGMSSRQQESDGYFHIRFFFEGETVELRAADRKVINAIDVNDVMGLEFDSNGIITGVTVLDDMPLEQVGWQFYVQSVGGKLLKLNSSKAMNGLEVMLDIHDFTGIWDMTGMEGEVGTAITPIGGDRVIAIANLAGELTHVYVYERPEYMKTFTAYCEHCKKDAEWKMWTKTSELPSDEGHYQLQNNISGMSKQQYINEDQKVCLDLNGMQVDGKENARVYTLHYPSAHLAIMDTSEGQTGVLRGHSTASDQGGVVWVRYGQFHLYAGTLDGSDMISKMNGAAMDIPAGAYFYMHGGKIIGGTAKAVKNDKGNWTNGIGGTMVVRGKFVMYDGIIEGGKATGVVTKYNADGTPNTYARGYAGNIYVGSGGVVEMNGGTIKGGTATHSGGNIYVDGTGEFTMNGGTITGGKVTGKGRNGGNVFVSAKSTFTLKSGQIVNGVSYNCAANLYTNGKFVMTGGYIGGGKIYNWSTRKLVPTENRANVFSVQGDIYMYGGRIDGSFYAIDTAADNNPTIVYLTTYASIYGAEDAQCDDMVLASGGDGVTCRVGNLRDSAKIGVNAITGIFTEPTAEANVDNFFSNIDDAEICYVDGCIALGRFSCLCGNNENGKAHYGECDGAKLFWGPLTGVDMPKVTGNYYIPRVADENGNLVPRTINCKEQSSMVEGAEIKLDLNGGTLLAKEHYRFFSLHNPNTFLTITDSSEGKTGVVKSRGQGTTQGNIIWVRYGRFDLYGGTLDGSAYTLHQSWEVGTDGLFGTADDKLSDRDGGTISMGGSTTFNMWGGTVIGNQAPRVEVTKTNKITTEVDGEEVTTTEEVKKLVGAVDGASLLVGTSATFNMYGGTIRDGYSENCGGNILANSKSVINLYAGTITGGQAGPAYKPGTTTVEVKGWGGNMDLASNSTLNILGEDVLITEGVAGGNGGNIRTLGTINMVAGTISNGESLTDQGGNLFNSGKLNLTGGLITDGKAKNGGNIGINSGFDSILDGVVIENGDAGTGYGGNIRMSTTNVNGKLVIDGDTIIRNGTAGYGANLAVATNTVNKNNPVATVEINGGIIEKGNASANGANINVSSSADSTTTLTINGGIIREGVTGQNGGGLYASGVNTEIIMNGGTFTGNVARWGGSILLSGIKGMTINGGTIENGTTIGNPSGTSGNGGNLKVDGNVPVTMNGGTIKGGKTGDFGGNVWTQGTFTMNGGTISGGEAKASSAKGGGNLMTNSTTGKFYLNGGTVEGGVAGKGGNIFLYHANALCIVDGATITGGSTTSGHGGNVNVASGTFTLKSGEVKDGVAKDTAGNIYTNGGTVIIEGGKVYGGTDKNGETSSQKNIYVVCAAIELRGGEIDGSVGVINYNNNNASVKMSGKPVIKSETASGLTLTWANGEGGTASKIPHINIDKPMTDGAEVYITSTKWEVGPITTATEEAYAEYFHADDEARSVGYAAGTIQLGKTHCLCGSTTETHEPGCDGEKLFWTPWASSTSLPITTGNYYIHPSVTVTLSSQQKITAADQKIVLDLNGRTVKNGEGKAIRGYWLSATGDEVTITDTVGGGKIVNNGTYDQGGIFWIGAGQTKVTLIKGTLDASGFTSRGSNAAGGVAVCLATADSTFTMYGGKLLGGTCPNGGGAIFGSNWDSRVYIYGGEVIGNENEENPSVRLMGTKNEIENATVTGGVEINSYRFDTETTKPINQLTLKSGANVDSILIADLADVRENGSGNYTILPLLTVDGTLANMINITTFNEEPHVFSATAVDASVLSKFSSASSKLTIIRNTDGKLELIANNDPTFHCICGTPAKHQQGCDGTRYRFTEWTSTNSLPITSGYYYLSKDVVLSGQQKITAADQNIVLDLNGKTVSNAEGKNLRFYWISAKSNLTITDCSDEQTGIMYNDGTYTQGMIVWVGAASSRFNLFNATLDTSDAKYTVTDGAPSNTAATSAICVSGGWSYCNMYSGTVNGGKSPYGGGAVTVNAGAGHFYLWDGEVNAHADDAAAIRSYGAVILNGGTVNGGVEFNEASDGTASGLWMSGSPKVDFIKLTDEANDGTADDNLRLLPITITSALEIEKPIKLYSFSDGVLTKTAENVTLDETALDWFFGMNHAIVLEAGQLKLVGGENVYCLCGSETETHAKGCDGTKYIWTAITDLSQIGTPGNYYLTGNMNVTAQYHFKTGETRLNLNGFTITDTSNRLFTTNGATDCVVTITDTSADKTGGLVVKHAEGYKYSSQGHALWINGASTLNWIAGNIDVSSTTSTKYGGNAIALEGNSTLNFYSGTITGGVSTRDASQSYSNWSEPCGGCIRINAGSTVNMYGGTIKNGRSVGTHGGNIALFGTMNMYGGVIENGSVGQFVNGTEKTNGHGGNISLLNANAVLNIEDGEIRNGTGVQWAGNIYGYYGTLQMSGGFIYGGKIGTTAASDTANIGMRTGFVAKLSGGNISGRIAMCAYNQTGTVYLSGSINLLNRTKDSYTDDGYRLKIYPADANGTPNINLIIGELDAGTILSITNARKTDFSVNGQTVNTNVKGQFATAAEGYTLTSADVSAVKVWYVGGSSGKTPGYADTSVLKSDNTIHFENLIADSAS